MTTRDLWSLEHCPINVELSNSAAYATLTSTYGRNTGLPGAAVNTSNLYGSVSVQTGGWLQLLVSSSGSLVMGNLAIKAAEVQNWTNAKQFWVGFRTKGGPTPVGAGTSTIFSICDVFAKTNFQTLLTEVQLYTWGGATAAYQNAEHFVEIFIDRTNLLYQVWIDGFQTTLGGALTAAAIPNDGSGFYFFGANGNAGTINTSRWYRDFYWNDVDGVAPSGRQGPMRAVLQPLQAASAPLSYAGFDGYMFSAILSTSQAKFGAQSGYFGQTTTNRLILNNSPARTFFNGITDATIEGWGFLSVITGTYTFFSKDTGASPFACVQLVAGTWKVFFDSATAGISVASGLVASQWYHIALVCRNSVWTLYQNGVALATFGSAGSPATFGNNNSLFSIGNLSAGSAAYWIGFIDEFRISNIARYTAAFTPPTAAFTTDANTISLFHFEGVVQADGTIQDNISDMTYGLSTPIANLVTVNGGFPSVQSGGNNDPLSASFAPSGSGIFKILAMDYRMGNKANYGCTVTPQLTQGSNVVPATPVAIDQTTTFGRRAALQFTAPDGTAWTPAKIAATSLSLTPNV